MDTLSGAACDYRARFSMECCDLDLTLAVGPGGALEGTLRLWRLEAVEHLPAAPGFAAAFACALDEVCPSSCSTAPAFVMKRMGSELDHVKDRLPSGGAPSPVNLRRVFILGCLSPENGPVPLGIAFMLIVQDL